MSAPEHNGDHVEQKSSIKAVRNAKGEAQFEVKVYEGTEDGELDRIRELTVAQFRALERELA